MGQTATATKPRPGASQPAPQPQLRQQEKAAPAPRAPGALAIENMAKLASAGATPDRMQSAVAIVLEQLMDAELDQEAMRERLEQLQADLDGGVEQVENADADTEGQRKAAAGQKAALVAARDAVEQAMERVAG